MPIFPIGTSSLCGSSFSCVGAIGLAACGGQGTEVLSPPNPSESPGPQQIETPLYEVKMDLPVGWTYTEYGPDVPPGPETFRDRSKITH